jgi:hypothetical protein
MKAFSRPSERQGRRRLAACLKACSPSDYRKRPFDFWALTWSKLGLQWTEGASDLLSEKFLESKGFSRNRKRYAARAAAVAGLGRSITA